MKGRAVLKSVPHWKVYCQRYSAQYTLARNLRCQGAFVKKC